MTLNLTLHRSLRDSFTVCMQCVLKFATDRKLRLSSVDRVSKHNQDPIKFYFLGGIHPNSSK